jgi:uncharacterized HhH-GPD family protein
VQVWCDLSMYLASTPAANELLEHDPLALLLGMMLDQQIPMEKAFTSPAVLRERLGQELDARALADHDPAEFEEIFSTPPALHRFPAAMAKRAQVLCGIVADRYDGDAASVWTTAGSGTELVARLQALPGFGPQKAKMFAALLGKQVGTRPKGWREASAPYGEDGTFHSAADVVDKASLVKVKAYKKQMKAAARASTA